MVVLDTNVVMEVLEKRGSLAAVTHVLGQYKQQAIAITTLTISNVFYLVEKAKGDVDTTEKLLKEYKIIGVLSDDAAWAFSHYKGKDFEDALQVAAARREKCTAFLTLDRKLAKKYGKVVPVKTI